MHDVHQSNTFIFDIGTPEARRLFVVGPEEKLIYETEPLYKILIYIHEY